MAWLTPGRDLSGSRLGSGREAERSAPDLDVVGLVRPRHRDRQRVRAGHGRGGPTAALRGVAGDVDEFPTICPAERHFGGAPDRTSHGGELPGPLHARWARTVGLRHVWTHAGPAPGGTASALDAASGATWWCGAPGSAATPRRPGQTSLAPSKSAGEPVLVPSGSTPSAGRSPWPRAWSRHQGAGEGRRRTEPRLRRGWPIPPRPCPAILPCSTAAAGLTAAERFSGFGSPVRRGPTLLGAPAYVRTPTRSAVRAGYWCQRWRWLSSPVSVVSICTPRSSPTNATTAAAAMMPDMT